MFITENVYFSISCYQLGIFIAYIVELKCSAAVDLNFSV